MQHVHGVKRSKTKQYDNNQKPGQAKNKYAFLTAVGVTVDPEATEGIREGVL